MYSVHAAESNQIVDKSKDQQIYEGVAVPLAVDTLYYNYVLCPGNVIYTAPIDTISHPAIIDSDNNIVRQADLLYLLNKEWLEISYKGKMAALKGEKAKLDYLEKNFNRNKALIKTNSISEAEKQQSEYEYSKAVSDHELARSDLLDIKYWLSTCAEYAKYDCIVTHVYTPLGGVAPTEEILKISQLNPMGIKVKMDHREALKIKGSMPVFIYPDNGSEPIMAYSYTTTLVEDGVIFKVRNTPVLPDINIDSNEKIVSTHQYYTVEPFYENSTYLGLAVPEKALRKDKDKYYVWRAGKEVISNGENAIFILKKAYIQPGTLKRDIFPSTTYLYLKDPGDLKLSDIIFNHEIPKDFEDGDKVCYFKERYLFMPGDIVKVRIYNDNENAHCRKEAFP